MILLVKQFVSNKYRLTLVTLLIAYYKDIRGQKRVSWNTRRDEKIWEWEKSIIIPVPTKLIGPLVAGLWWYLTFTVTTGLPLTASVPPAGTI